MSNSGNKGLFSKRNIIIFCIAFVIILIGVGVFIFYNHYKSRWFKGTTIMGEDVSGLTFDESKGKLMNKCNAYVLNIKGRDGLSMSVSKENLKFEISIDNALTELFNSQHNAFPSLFSKNEYDLKYDISYDDATLKKLLEDSELIKGNASVRIQKPIPSRLAFDKEKECYVFNEEVAGNIIKKPKLMSKMKTAMQNATPDLNIDSDEHKDVYKAPGTGADEDDVKVIAENLNSVVVRFIPLKLTKGIKEVIRPKLIKKWVKYENRRVKIKDRKVEKWVDNFCKKYDTVGKTRKVKSHTGKMITVPGGDYGWQTDRENLLKTIMTDLKKKLPQEKINSYIENKSGKKGITIKEKAPMLNTAFKWSDNKKKVVDWDPKNYTEISIADQMVYVFRKGKVKFKCRCITGLPVGDRATKIGTFYIKEHLPEHTMVGADYRTYVRYWVRITWTGTGFHPANWQPWSRWSPTYYRSGGSHGCINLSPTDAISIYNLVKYREAVFIHY